MAASNNSGSVTLELMIALAIFSITTATLASVALDNRLAISKNTDNRIDLYAAESALNDSLRDGKAPSGGFARYVTPCQKILSAGGLISGLQTVWADIEYSEAVGGDCGGRPPSGDWSSPATRTLVSPAAPGSARAIDVLGQTAYVGINSPDTSESTLAAFDIQSGSLANTLAIPRGLNSLDAARGYVYIAAMGGSEQFIIADAHDPAHYEITASETLPGVAGSYPSGLSVLYYQSKAYVGTHRTAGHEFHIYDVENPRSPVWLGSIELNHNINAIAIRWPYAYLATSGNVEDIIVLDISDPARIVRVSAAAFLGNEDTISIFFSGDTLYAGRKKGTLETHPELVVLDIADPSNPRIAAAFHLGGDVTAMRVSGQHAFLVASHSPWSAYIFDISDPDRTSAIYKTSFASKPIAIDHRNDTTYLLLENGELVTISPK